jgi:hypothetical protein
LREFNVRTSPSRFSLVASVSELGLLSSLARTPRRLAISAVVATIALLLYGVVVAGYVLHRSGSVELNLVLLSAQFFLVLIAGYVQAMWLGSRVFGDAWRRRTFLGERPELSDEDEDKLSVRDYSLHFYGVFALTCIGSYLAVVLVTGDYVDRYNVEGYTTTLLRSGAPEERIEALRGLVDPVHDASRQGRLVQAAVVEALADEDEDVRAWAAWTAGHLLVHDAVEPLLQLYERGTEQERVEAVIALGRLSDPAAERRVVSQIRDGTLDPSVAPAAITALGLIPSFEAVEPLTALLGVGGDVEAAAVWAMGATRSTAPREAVLARWAVAEGDDRCVVAEALKHVTTVEDDRVLRAAFASEPGLFCEERAYEGRQYSDERVAPTAVWVVGEDVRMKVLKAVFNIGGPDLLPWLEGIAWDEAEVLELRLEADRMAALLRSSPARPPRR